MRATEDAIDRLAESADGAEAAAVAAAPDGDHHPDPGPGWFWFGVAAISLFLVGIVVVVPLMVANGWEMIDLDIYRWGGHTARVSDGLYRNAHDRNHHGILFFTYTPMAAIVFMPLSLVDLWVAEAMMFIADLAAILITVWVSFRSLGYRPGRGRLGIVLAVTAMAVGFEPVTETIKFGQINLILMAIIVVDLLLPDDSRWKGIGVGLATGLKLTPAIFVPYLFLTGRVKASVRAGAVFVATILVGYLMLPTESQEFWGNRLFSDPSRVGNPALVSNQSLNGALVRLFGSSADAHTAWLIAAVIAGGVAMAIAIWLHRRGRELAGIVACAATGLLVSPVSWSHHWVWVVPALVLGTDAALRRRRRSWIAVGAGVGLFFSFPFFPGLIWKVPHDDDAGSHWTPLQMVVGNLYLLVTLLTMAVASVWIVVHLRRTGARFRPHSLDLRGGPTPTPDT